jgi:hypothetical protein
MASKKSDLLEHSLQEDLHPFAARKSAEAQITAELHSGNTGTNLLRESRFFQKSNKSVTPLQDPSSQDEIERPHARTISHRSITRYAFEFFQDQIETLRDFSLDEKMRGEKGSMSQMVREAIDAYVSKRKNSEQ